MAIESKQIEELFSESTSLLDTANTIFKDREDGLLSRDASESRMTEAWFASQNIYRSSLELVKQISSKDHERLYGILESVMSNCSTIAAYKNLLMEYNCQKIVKEVLGKEDSTEG